MAKKKVRTPAPAPWFRESLRKQRALEAKAFAAKSDAAYENLIAYAEEAEAKRDADIAYLHDSIKLLRHFAPGFEARDGFDLRHIPRIAGRKLAKVRKLAGLIRQELATPHVEVLARNKAQKKALTTYTGQKDVPGRKRFVVFTETPTKTRVKIVKPKKTKARKKAGAAKSRVEIEVQVPGGVAREEFFYIEDYLGDEPADFRDVKRALKKMLPDMPKGWYVLVTSNHGNIGVPNQRHNLMAMLDSDYIQYDNEPNPESRKDNRGLATVIVGFKLVSFTKEGANREYIERLSRRERLNRFRKAQYQQRRRARLTGRR